MERYARAACRMVLTVHRCSEIRKMADARARRARPAGRGRARDNSVSGRAGTHVVNKEITLRPVHLATRGVQVHQTALLRRGG
jgi:hypothetical protein